MILQLLFHLRRPLMLNSRLKTLSLGRGLPNLSPILHIDIHTTHIVAPVIVLYDNSTNMPLPLLSYTVINTANSFVAEPWPFIINDCISDPPTNLRCADTYIWLKRTYITKSIAILSLVVGWLLALMTVVLAVIAWRGPSKESSEDQTKRTRPGRRISENVLLFPIATTLAIPALRSLFPAAPPTGILFDHVGIYPQLLLIFGCGIFLSWVVIYRRLKGRTEKVSTGDAARDSTHHPDTVHFGLHERDGVDETEHESAKGVVSPDK